MERKKAAETLMRFTSTQALSTPQPNTSSRQNPSPFVSGSRLRFSAAEHIVPPEPQPVRVGLAVEEVEVMLSDEEVHVADGVVRPAHVTHLRACQVGWDSDTVDEVAADVRLHQLIRVEAHVPVRDRRR